MEQSKVKGWVLLGVIFISFSSILTKASIASPLVVATYRLGFATIMLLPIVLKNHREELKNVNLRTMVWCAVSGVFLALHFVTWMTSIHYTSIASSTTLVNTHPVFIVLMMIGLFKERYTKKVLMSIFIAVAGSAVISGSDLLIGNHMLYGDLLALAGGFFVAGYMLIGKSARSKLSVHVYTFIVYGACTIVLLVMDVATQTPLYPYPATEWMIFLGLAVFCTLLGHSIFNWALGYLNPALVSTAVLGEPVLATVWALLLFKEAPTMMQVIGGIIILTGIFMYVKQEENKQEIEIESVS